MTTPWVVVQLAQIALRHILHLCYLIYALLILENVDLNALQHTEQLLDEY